MNNSLNRTVIFLLFTLPILAQAELPPGSEKVTVDWFEESMQGGITMVALGILSVALVYIILDRMIHLKPKHILPAGLLDKAIPLCEELDCQGLATLASAHPSIFADVLMVISRGAGDEVDRVLERAADLAAREMEDEENRLQALGLIAGLAPLLGLLGTMIGMIESFKLVEVFGDEGGASMLAGSISKALITTAAGLILAMPALLAHHVFLRKTQRMMYLMENALERLAAACRAPSSSIHAD